MESLAASLGFDEVRLAELSRQYRVREFSIFGSAARGEMRPDSDIDVLVEFQPNSGIGLLDFSGLMLDLGRTKSRPCVQKRIEGTHPRRDPEQRPASVCRDLTSSTSKTFWIKPKRSRAR